MTYWVLLSEHPLYIENFFTIILKLNVFLLCIPAGICGHSQMPAITPVNRGTCENTWFGEHANMYSCIYCCKLQTPIKTHPYPLSNTPVWWSLNQYATLSESREFLFALLYAHSTWVQQKSTKWALYWHVKLSMNIALEWLFQYFANTGLFLVT